MKYIAADKVGAVLEELSARAQVWAPRELPGSGGTVLFERWQAGGVVDYGRITSMSAKDLILPRTEKLFGFSYRLGAEGEQVQIEDRQPVPEAVLFGARACDARALTVLDPLFDPSDDDAYSDPHYRERRAALTVITIACTSCDSACFCSSFGDGPAEKRGSDLILIPVDGGFLAQAVSDKGGNIAGSPLFEDSALEAPPLAETARVEDIGALREDLRAIFEDLEFWQGVTATCISCGFCTYACPACHCFNIHDEMRSDREGERLRSWDACMFYLYTQETSGHNPRPEPAHRYRNRINHKFSYYPENQGELLCTGCGRCIRGCPVGIDIREVLKKARKRSQARQTPGSGKTEAQA